MARIDVYKSKAWKEITRYIWLKQQCLCARCKRPVYKDGISKWIPPEQRLKGIVHHKEYLTEINYLDDAIAYDEDNLEGLCIDCHNREHKQNIPIRKDLMFDDYGNIIPISPNISPHTNTDI